jgi:hypothetical protein
MQKKNPQAKKKVAKRPQQDDFKSVAKRLGCDEDRTRFEEKLGKIVRATSKTKGP